MKIKIILFFLFLILVVGFFYWDFGCPKNASIKETQSFLVKNGEGIKEIGQNLKNQGLINSQFVFDVYALIARKNLKAGNYSLSPSMSISDIAQKLSLGETSKKTITIIEGWTIGDIQNYFKEKEISGEIDSNLEGYLFPDTYIINFQATAGEAAEIMEQNFESKLTQDLRKEISLQGKTISEIVTMASLLEKEVRPYKDKQMVAGLLWKRIESKMPLQVDAAKETYKHLGLPAAPICNPGLESIKAAIYPIKTNYWFYLSTRAGTTIFSRTLAEHNQAIEEYLK